MQLSVHIFFCILLLLAPTVSFADLPEHEIIRIGALAKRGKEECTKKWGPTVAYLNSTVPGYRFLLVPLNFEELPEAVAENRVHFTLSNPAMYVELEYRYGVTRLATLKNKNEGNAYTKFGGVIFTRADRQDINETRDLGKDTRNVRGKQFMAVNPRSFGGWIVSWRHLIEQDINPHKDFQSLLFGDTHDAVVYAVINGTVDGGAVRTDTLERMAREGKIHLEQIKVLDKQAAEDTDFAFLRTTRLYPEWPFAKTRQTSEELARKVVIALLAMKPNSKAARESNSMGWTIPLDYTPVHECLKALHLPPYEHLGKISFRQLLEQYWPWLVTAFCFVLFLTGTAAYVLALNSRLQNTMGKLDHELIERERMVYMLNEFKQTLDQVLDCVFMFAPDTLVFSYANRGALLQIGYSYDELLTMTPLDIKPEFDEHSFRKMIAPLINGLQDSLTLTTVQQHKDGHTVPVEVVLQHVRNTQAQGTFVAVVRDISMRLAEQKEKEQLQAQLLHTQKLESVGHLAAGIAHEINTPIQFIGSNIDFFNEAFTDLEALINTFAALLAAAQKTDIDPQLINAVQKELEELDWDYLAEEIPEAINQSRDGVHRVSSIVRAMKEFSHPGGKEKEPIDLNRLIETTVTVARNEWKYVAEMDLNLQKDLVSIPCLADEMGQVFLNLLVNAAQAIAGKLGDNPTGDKGAISISTGLVEKMVEIRMTDTGMGIPEDILGKVFDPFFTTKEVGEGTGQGLAITRDVIVNKHGGTIEVESEVGKGTSFIIRLPT